MNHDTGLLQKDSSLLYLLYLVGSGAGGLIGDGRLGEDSEELSHAAVRDPDLGAVQDVVLPVGGQL